MTIDDFARDVYLNDTTGENWIENIIHTAHLPSLLGRLPPPGAGETIIELGFGEGTITGPLLDAGYQVEVVEGSADLCAHARARYAGRPLRVHCSLFEEFTPERPAKNVLALHVLEHVDDTDEVLRAVYQWMAPGGQVIAVVPNADSFHRQLAVMMGLQDRNDSPSPRDLLVGHRRVLTLGQLVASFEGAGFEIVERFGYFLKVVPNGMMADWPPSLIQSLTAISDQVPAHLLANVGVIATIPSRSPHQR